MATVNYIKPRGGIFHYERRFPVEVTRLPYWTRGAKFQVTLKTSDKKVARERAVEKDREFEQICQEALNPAKAVATAAPSVPQPLTDGFLQRLSEQSFRESVMRDAQLERRAEIDPVAADEVERRATQLAPVFRGDWDGTLIDEVGDSAKHREHLKREFTNDSASTVDAYARERGIKEGTLDYALIRDAVVKGKLRAYRAGSEKMLGDLFPAGFIPDASPINLDVATDWTLGQLSEAYIKDSKVKPAWLNKIRPAVEVFQAWHGKNKTASSIDAKIVRKFIRFLQEVPVKAKERFPGLSVVEATAKNKSLPKPYTTLAPNTIKDGYIGALRRVLSHGVKEHDYRSNPFLGAEVEGAKRGGKKSIFDIDELNAIFALPVYRGCRSNRLRLKPGNYQVDDHEFWTPLLMLFTGARVSEIAQLALTDIKLDASVPYIDILTEYDESDPDDRPFVVSGKTENAKRRIPIHPELFRIGFADYVNRIKRTKQPRLFPDWKQSSNELKLYSSATWCVRFNQKIVPSVTSRKPKPTLYSLRHVFKTRMALCGVAPQFQNEILGHSQVGMDSTYLHLADDLGALQKAINLVHYEGLRLPDRAPSRTSSF